MKMPKFSMKKAMDSFKTRSFRVGGYSIFATIIVLAIAVVVNLLVNALPASVTQIDVSAAQLTSISEQTESVVGAVDTDVTIYWVVQEGYEDTTIQTLLNRYASLNKHISVEQKDPDVYPTFVSQYYSGAIYNNSLIVVSGDRSRYVSYEEIYLYDTTNYNTTGEYSVSFDGESALTSAIDYVVSENIPRIYTLTGHGESTMASSYSTSVKKENMDLEEISLLTAAAVPEDADAVMICMPQRDISEEETAMLKDYLAAGGNLILISMPPKDEPLDNLNALMAGYGVTAAEGVVVDPNQNYYGLGVPYYLLPAYGSHEITAPLAESGYRVLMPVSQGLMVSDELPDGVSVDKLLTTSGDSFSKMAGYSLTTYEKEEGDIDGPFALAVHITADAENGGESNIVWISSGAILDETTNAQASGGNKDFFLNALNYLVEPESSNISIRAKDLSTDYLTMSSGTASVLTMLVLVIIPLGYLGVGIVIWFRRKHR